MWTESGLKSGTSINVLFSTLKEVYKIKKTNENNNNKNAPARIDLSKIFLLNPRMRGEKQNKKHHYHHQSQTARI